MSSPDQLPKEITFPKDVNHKKEVYQIKAKPNKARHPHVNVTKKWQLVTGIRWTITMHHSQRHVKGDH